MSLPYSHDFYSNRIGVAVTFTDVSPDEEINFWKFYGLDERPNWTQRIAYQPIGISNEFRTPKNFQPHNCIKVVMSIGNGHRTKVQIEVQNCDKDEE